MKTGKNLNEQRDILGHQAYVDKLTAYISEPKERDFKQESYVIGLEGEWGIGKTWILNTLKLKLEKEKLNINTIYLDSWTSFGYEYFIKNYYRELRDKTLNWFCKLWDVNFKTLISELEKNTQFIDKIPSIFGYSLIPIIYILLDLLDFGLNFISDSYIRKFIVFIASVIVYFFVKIIINHFVEQKPYNKVKADIQRAITNKFSKNPIVVIIDDLDRSDPQDIKQIFKMLKSDANFAHVIYLLSYDRKIIEEKLTKDEADFFFDKIVQLPIQIKNPDKKVLQNYLREKIETILSGYSYVQKELQDQYLFDLLFVSQIGLINQFKNLRMIDKFLLCFENELENSKDYLGYDICLGDLALIEFIRLYDPNVYNYIKKNQRQWLNTQKIKKRQEILPLTEIETVFKDHELQTYSELLSYTHNMALNSSPPNYKIMGGKIDPANPETLSTYFSNTILGDSQRVSQKDIEELYAKDITRDSLQEFLKDKDVRHFCSALDKFIQIKGVTISKFIKPLLEVGDQYEFTWMGPSGEQNAIIQFLSIYYQNHNPELKFADLIGAESILTLLHFLDKFKKNKDSQLYQLSITEWEDLGHLIHEKMKSNFNSLLDKPSPDFISTLYSWRNLVSESEFGELKKLIEGELQTEQKQDFDPKKFIKMLTKFSQNGGINDLMSRIAPLSAFTFASYKNLSYFVDLEKIKEIIELNKLMEVNSICKDFIDCWGAWTRRSVMFVPI